MTGYAASKKVPSAKPTVQVTGALLIPAGAGFALFVLFAWGGGAAFDPTITDSLFTISP